MKPIFYGIIILLFTGSSIYAQPAFLQKETDGKGSITFARFGSDTAAQSLSQSAELLKSLYSSKLEDEMKISEERQTEEDELGYTHRFHQQYYKGIKVEGGEFSVHAFEGNIKSILGNFIPVGEVDVTPVLSESEALESALQHIGAETYKWEVPEEEARKKEYCKGTYYPKGELSIVKGRLTDSVYRLAYRFEIYAHRPMSSDCVWVDAITGEVINRISQIKHANATGTAATRYSGTRTITTDLYNGVYRLREIRDGINISTYNMNHTGILSSTDLTDADNNWTATEYHNASNDDAILDAHWGSEMTYAYFKQVHLWNNWKDSSIISYVNADLHALDSSEYEDSNGAFYSGYIVYGQGSDLTGPFTPLDVCAHEIGHKFCSSTAKVAQISSSERSDSIEIAALQEGLSDIWGACVENWATTGKETWVAGGDLTSSLHQRRLSSPITYNTSSWDPDTTVSVDNLAHSRGRVISFWFYLLSQGGSDFNGFGNTYLVAGIGIEKAAKIVFRAERWHLDSRSTFVL